MRKNVLRTVTAAIVFNLSLSTTIVYSQPDIQYDLVVGSGLNQPLEVHTAPGDAQHRLFIVQKTGTIRIWKDSLKVKPFLDVSSISVDDGERGLLSMAFHPDFQSNGFFYIYYNNNAGNVVVARYQVSADSNIANTSGTSLISIPKPFDNHNGGHLQFRVEGGTNYLYFATGDGGSGNDPFNNSQNPTSFLGKMIRIDVDAGTPTPEIWAWGLRNPFRWSFDRATGDIWIGDVGQGLKEEVDFRPGGTRGANYGWACFEGALNNSVSAPDPTHCDTVDAVDVPPIFQYDNPASGSSSVIGGYVYRGTAYPSMQGYYMMADFYSGQFWFIWPNGVGLWNTFTDPELNTPGAIASFSETDDGDTIYAVSLGGNAIYRLTALPIVTPLTLVRFSGRAGSGYNDLEWTTEFEDNIEKYIVEFSSDGRNYNNAGEVVSLNNSSRANYSFRHNTTYASKIFYRLKITEHDGSFSYSPVVIIRGDGSTPIKIYPTVISNNRVNIISPVPVGQITIIGTDGRRMLTKDVNNINGYFTFPLPGLQQGMYFIRLTGNGFQQTERIIIQ